jgi:hypothetical protein
MWQFKIKKIGICKVKNMYDLGTPEDLAAFEKSKYILSNS